MMVYAMFEKGVKQNLLGVGSALTVIFLAFVLILTMTQVYFVNRGSTTDDRAISMVW